MTLTPTLIPTLTPTLTLTLTLPHAGVLPVLITSMLPLSMAYGCSLRHLWLQVGFWVVVLGLFFGFVVCRGRRRRKGARTRTDLMRSY